MLFRSVAARLSQHVLPLRAVRSSLKSALSAIRSTPESSASLIPVDASLSSKSVSRSKPKSSFFTQDRIPSLQAKLRSFVFCKPRDRLIEIGLRTLRIESSEEGR